MLTAPLPVVVTAVGAASEPAVRLRPLDGLAACVSTEVLTDSAVLAIDTGSAVAFTLVIPAIVNETAVLVATAHEAPARVTVTTCADIAPVAVQLVKPETSAIVGVAGIVTTLLAGKVTTNVPAAASAPPTVSVVAPIVQVDVCWLTVEAGENVTPEIPITTAELGLASVVSPEVWTRKPLAAYVAGIVGFVKPPNVIVVAVAAVGNAVHAVYVMVTTWPEPAAVTVEQVAPVSTRPVGEAGTVIPVGNVTNSVFPATNVVVGVNPTVQVFAAPATVELGLKVTAVAVAAPANVAVPSSTIAITMATAVNLFMRWMGLKPDESSCPTTE
jgi:hypothetical protein